MALSRRVRGVPGAAALVAALAAELAAVLTAVLTAVLAVAVLPLGAWGQGGADTTRAAGRRGADTTQSGRTELVPAGYGTLRRDDVAIVVQVQGLTARAIPLEESVIRLLAPDSYRSLHALRESRAVALERIRSRTGLSAVQAWHVEFFNVQQGEARFDPRGMQVRSTGRDFRPLDIVPLVPGFEDGRLAQGRTVSALFVFDAAITLTQPLAVTLAGQPSSAWGEVLPRLERERAAIASRAAAPRKPTPDGGSVPW